jgi:hypothetical protein
MKRKEKKEKERQVNIKMQGYLVVTCENNQDFECWVEYGEADEILSRHEDVALVPLEPVVDALRKAGIKV